MIFKYSDFNDTPYESHELVLSKIEKDSKVLDVGCATGYFAKELKKKNCLVWGVEQDRNAAKEAEKYCEEVIVGDIEGFTNSSTIRGVMASHPQPATSEVSLPFKKDFFDYILLLDVIEHLREPLSVVRILKSYLKQNHSPQGSHGLRRHSSLPPPGCESNKSGKIIISTPNIAHISIRAKLLMGKFDYEEKGIMDNTHLKFFTKKTLTDMILQAGMKLQEIDYPADFGQLPFAGRLARRIPKTWQYRLTKLYPSLLAAQVVAICSI